MWQIGKAPFMIAGANIAHQRTPSAAHIPARSDRQFVGRTTSEVIPRLAMGELRSKVANDAIRFVPGRDVECVIHVAERKHAVVRPGAAVAYLGDEVAIVAGRLIPCFSSKAATSMSLRRGFSLNPCASAPKIFGLRRASRRSDSRM